MVEWTFAVPLLLTPLFGDVESSMGEVSHKIQLNLCLKIKDIKGVFDQERALLCFFKLHDTIITTEDGDPCSRLQEKGI